MADVLTLSGDNLTILDADGKQVWPVVVVDPPPPPPPPPPPVDDGPKPPDPVTLIAAGDNVQDKLNGVPSGGSLVIPAGVSVGALRGKAGVTLWADGVVNVSGNFDFSNLSGWTVRGKSPGHGFVFNGCRINATGAHQFAVGNNVFNNQPSNGFDGSGVQLTGASVGLVINNDFNGSQGNVLGMYNLDNITFDGNHFVNCRQPLSLQGNSSTAQGNNIVIKNNVFVGTTRAAMEIGPSATTGQFFSGTVVDNNYFDDFRYQGADNFSALLAISLVGWKMTGTTVTNNFIRMGDANHGNGCAIEFTGPGECTNNTIWGWRFAGFTYQYQWNVHDNVEYQTPVQFYANSPKGVTYTGTFANNNPVTTAPVDPGWPARSVW